jgi:hypothetical protein
MTAPRITASAMVTMAAEEHITIDAGLIRCQPEQLARFRAAMDRGQPVTITIEPAPVPPEPLTGGPADIGVRVRIKRDWIPGSALSGKEGALASYGNDGHAWIRDPASGGYWAVPPDQIERATAECPHCGASQVTR